MVGGHVTLYSGIFVGSARRRRRTDCGLVGGLKSIWTTDGHVEPLAILTDELQAAETILTGGRGLWNR